MVRTRGQGRPPCVGSSAIDPPVFDYGQLSESHRLEILWHLGPEEAAGTRWKLVEEYPVDILYRLAREVDPVVDRDLLEHIRRHGLMRAILFDPLADEQWMEGVHRTIVANELGWQTIPTLVRVK